MNVLSSNFLTFFGKRSYSFYLVHYPIISFSYYVVGFSLTLLQTLAVLFLIFIFGILLFHSVEQRFVKNRITYSQPKLVVNNRTLVFFVASFSSVVLVTSLLVKNTGGLMFMNKYELLNFTNKYELKKIASTIHREQILCSETSVLDCIKKSPNSKVVLLGDSNAYHFAIGAKKYSPNNEVISLTKGGCMPLARSTRIEISKTENNKCFSFNDDVDKILQTDFPKDRVAVISAAWLLYLYGDNLYKNEPKSKLAEMGNIVLGNDRFETIPNDKKILVMRQYLIDLVNKLSKKFTNIVILGPLPPQPFAVRSEARLQFYGHNGTSSNLFFSYANPLLEVFEEIENLKLSNVDVIYPHQQLCDAIVKDRCVGFYNGKHYYGDETHVSAVGRYVAYSELFKYLENL